jgi:uncharacterized membrane protein YeaQ/YmgE (transglycosylase-associated protein family)
VSILIVFGIGIVVGVIAAFLGGAGSRFVFVHALIGVAGAVLGGILLARELGDKAYSPDHFDGEAIGWACGGAVVLLAAAKLLNATLLRRQ